MMRCEEIVHFPPDHTYGEKLAHPCVWIGPSNAEIVAQDAVWVLRGQTAPPAEL